MADVLSPAALDQLFRTARTHRAWLNQPIAPQTLHDLYDLLRFGPTSSNTCPARFVFLTTPAAKERLVPALAAGNVDKTRAAPVCVIVAYDSEFYEQLPKLSPSRSGGDARAPFLGKPDFIAETAFRNGSLQGAYLILAARAVGLDCGPMSGFEAEKVNAEFFPQGSPEAKWKANFLCNLGHGDASKLHPRAARLSFEEACRVL